MFLIGRVSMYWSFNLSSSKWGLQVLLIRCPWGYKKFQKMLDILECKYTKSKIEVLFNYSNHNNRSERSSHLTPNHCPGFHRRLSISVRNSWFPVRRSNDKTQCRCTGELFFVSIHVRLLTLTPGLGKFLVTHRDHVRITVYL